MSRSSFRLAFSARSRASSFCIANGVIPVAGSGSILSRSRTQLPTVWGGTSSRRATSECDNCSSITSRTTSRRKSSGYALRFLVFMDFSCQGRFNTTQKQVSTETGLVQREIKVAEMRRFRFKRDEWDRTFHEDN